MDYFEPSKRQGEEKRPLRDRKKGFGEVTSTLTKEVALMEGERCFSCGTCNECENCYIFCPDASILKREGKIFHQVDYDFCKGCGVCFVECPRRAISLEEEAR
jgi:2-oxoacid:acceptor oxidoreductase delta subunit (pyruvate/2-ketoisovalerate family)